ncbi:MAG TPA: NADH-quinone oxidoreductase subunit C [Actinomycetota bacterium]|nr:NADH-quinone oxidoreductase subunit C [Actinomycetota bacterium]
MPVTQRVVGDSATERVRTALGDKVSEVANNFDQVDLVCSPDNLVEVVTALRDGDLGFRFFTFLSAVDRSELAEDKSRFGHKLEVLIHLYSPEHATHVNIHVPIEVAKPVCPSITGVFQGAEWHERECHEMFGIDFAGHPRLVNLYLPEDFEGNPGLKSFKLPSRALVKPWPGAKDPEEAAGGK